MMCSSFNRRTINVWMIFQSVCFHINLHTSHVWSKYQHSNTSYKHSTSPWMSCLSLHHLYHSISVSSLLVVSHSLVSISHSLNPLILIHMCLTSSHSTPHTTISMFSCPFSSMIRSAHHSFPLFHPITNKDWSICQN